MRHATITAAVLTAAAVLAVPVMTIPVMAAPAMATTVTTGDHAATVLPAGGGCAPTVLSSYRPRWHIACTRETPVAVRSVYDSYSKSSDPQPVHEDHSFTHTVRPGETWVVSEAVPEFMYVHHSCVTVQVAGRQAARSCFDRPRLATDGEPPAIEASSLTALPAGWDIGAGTAGARMRVVGDYVYRTAHGHLAVRPFTRVKALADGQRGQWADSVAVPDGATVLSADLTAVAVAPDGSTTWIGTTTYRAGSYRYR